MQKRIEGPTPSGGKYAILYYYDSEGKSADEKLAVKCIACEFDENDKLIRETTLLLNNNNKEQEV